MARSSSHLDLRLQANIPATSGLPSIGLCSGLNNGIFHSSDDAAAVTQLMETGNHGALRLTISAGPENPNRTQTFAQEAARNIPETSKTGLSIDITGYSVDS